MRAKTEMLQELGAMLREVLKARSNGVEYSKVARAQGMVDGYMRALLESGLVSKNELLELVSRQRSSIYGPSTGYIEMDELDSAAA